MYQEVLEPTREFKLLDLVLCKGDDLIGNQKVHETFSTGDHSYITFTMMHDKECKPSRVCNSYKAADRDLMPAHLATTDRSSVFIGVVDYEDTRGRPNEKINNLIYLYVPFKMSSTINAP